MRIGLINEINKKMQDKNEFQGYLVSMDRNEKIGIKHKCFITKENKTINFSRGGSILPFHITVHIRIGWVFSGIVLSKACKLCPYVLCK